MSLAQAERFARKTETPRRGRNLLIVGLVVMLGVVGVGWAVAPDVPMAVLQSLGGGASPAPVDLAQTPVDAAARDGGGNAITDRQEQGGVGASSQVQEREGVQPVALDGDAAAPAAAPCDQDALARLSTAQIAFAPGEHIASDATLAPVLEAARALNGCPDLDIRVLGHANPNIDGALTRLLSWRRAEAVIARLGAENIDVSAYSARGLGLGEEATTMPDQPGVTFMLRKRAPVATSDP
ncbi:MAG: hypothetical protein AAGJ96_00535 [Pseudomonadota bacterium]